MEIYTYGSGRFIASIFEAVKLLNSGGTIVSLVKIFLIVSLLYGLAAGVLRGFSRKGVGHAEYMIDENTINIAPLLILIRNAFVAAICVYVFLSPYLVTDVVVEDRYDPAQSQVVTQVPYGIAFIGYTSSVIGDRMGEVIEEYITPVEAVRFRSGGGVAIGPKYVNELFELFPPGAESDYDVGTGNVPTRGVLEAWFSECIYPNFALIEGETVRAEGLKAFTHSKFIINDPVFQSPPFYDPNTPLSVQYYGYPDPNQTTCANAVPQIISKWYNNPLFEKWIQRFSAKSFGTKEDDPTIVPRIYEMVDRYFPDNSIGVQDKLVQIATLNSAYSAYLKISTEYGSGSASDLAKRKQGAAWIEAARMGTKALFLMRQVAEASMYLFGVFLPVFIAIGGLGPLAMYIKVVFWLQLWIPIFVVFNAISDYQLLRVVDSISYCMGGTCSLTLNFETVDKLRTETSMILGYMGLISVSAPGIAWGIMHGANSLVGAASGIASSHHAASTASSATTERVGALAGYSAGTMLASAQQAGIGQTRMAGHLKAVDRYGGLGTVQNTAQLELGHSMRVRAATMAGQIETANQYGQDAISKAARTGLEHNIVTQTPTQKGEIAATKEVGAQALEQVGMTNIASQVGRAEGLHSIYNAARERGLISPNASFQDFMKNVNQIVSFSTDYGKVDMAVLDNGRTVWSITQSGSSSIAKGVQGVKYGGMVFQNANITTDGNNTRIESQTRDPALLGQLAQKANDLGQSHTAQDLREMQKEIQRKPGSSARVVVSGDANGNISNIKAERVGEASRVDRGVEDRITNKYSGYTSWSGSRTTLENTYDKVGIIRGNDPETGKEGLFYGRQHFDSTTGKMVASDYTNLNTGRVYTTRTDEQGNKHYGVGTYESGPRGSTPVFNFRELSNEEIQRGMYSASRTIGGGGVVLDEKATAGQSVMYNHSFTMNLEKKMEGSLGSVVIGQDADLTNLSDSQTARIIGASSVEKAVELITKADATKNVLKEWSKGKPTDYVDKNIPIKPGSNVGEIHKK